MKKTIVFGLGLLIILAAALACGGSADNTGTATTSSDNQAQASAKHFKVGQNVKVGDTWEVTVNSVNTSTGEDYNKPDAGNVFLIVNVTTKNISNKEQNISSLLNFKLKESDGTEAKIGVLTKVSPAPNGKVEAGDQSKGDLVYEVSSSKKSFTLSFEADIISGGQTIWDIND